jgi:hypothetical protein
MPETQEPNLLVEIARGIGDYRGLLERLSRTERATLAGAAGALPGILLAAIRRDLARPLAVVVAVAFLVSLIGNLLR